MSLIIDRKFRTIGRVRKRSGTDNAHTRKLLNETLTALDREGRGEYLDAWVKNDITLQQLHRHYKAKTLHLIPLGKTAKLLGEAMTAWAESEDYSDKHREGITTTVRLFKRHKKDAKVSEVASLLETIRVTYGKQHPRSFNLARVHALAFVRATLKKSHPLWMEVSAVEPRKEAKDTARHPLTPTELSALFPNPTTDPVDAVAWSMATTGMGPKEYWGLWTVKADRIDIHGTKRASRKRSVPRIWTPCEPQLTRSAWEQRQRKRTRVVTPYDLRRTFANWMEASGIPRTRRKLYLGHASGDVTDLYERHEVTAHLKSDAAKLCRYADLPQPATTHITHAADLPVADSRGESADVSPD